MRPPGAGTPCPGGDGALRQPLAAREGEGLDEGPHQPPGHWRFCLPSEQPLHCSSKPGNAPAARWKDQHALTAPDHVLAPVLTPWVLPVQLGTQETQRLMDPRDPAGGTNTFPVELDWVIRLWKSLSQDVAVAKNSAIFTKGIR